MSRSIVRTRIERSRKILRPYVKKLGTIAMNDRDETHLASDLADVRLSVPV